MRGTCLKVVVTLVFFLVSNGTLCQAVSKAHIKTRDHNLSDLQKGCAGELGWVGPLGMQAPGSGVVFRSKCSKQEFKAF